MDEEVEEEESLSEEESLTTIDELVEYEEIPEDIELTSEFFLNYQSPSFICLHQVESSHSTFFKDFRNFFPPLPDPGIDKAFNYEPPEDTIDNIGIENYLKRCKEMKIIPYRHIINSLQTKELNLKYFKLSLDEFKALKDTLKYNGFIEKLVFQDNWLQPEQVEIISEILIENARIKTLDLQECRIGEKGAEKLFDGIIGTQFLEELNLSFNDLKDEGLQVLKDALINNASIKKLNLSHNGFTERSAKIVQAIITNNKCIVDLDLSWNYFYHGPSVRAMFKTLVENEHIKRLHFSFNGVCTRAGLSKLLLAAKTNGVLEYIDISYNRIANNALKGIKEAITKSETLVEMKVGNNLYTPDAAQLLAKNLLANKFKMKTLDMENILLNRNCLMLLQQLEQAGKKVNYGYILGNYKIYGPDVSKLLFERSNYLAQKPKKKKKKKDFGQIVMLLPDDLVLKQDFFTLIKKSKAKVDKDLVDAIANHFATKKGDKVDCFRMKVEYLRLYPDTIIPEPKPKKKKKGKGKGKGKKKKK